MAHLGKAFGTICVIATLTIAAMFSGCSGGGKTESAKSITPTEDLLREHAVISRLELIFGESNRRLRANLPLQPQVLTQTCDITRRFVQNYHEKNEEKYIFTGLEQVGQLNDITGILRKQHDAGRKLIDNIGAIAKSGKLQDPANRNKLEGMLDAFIRMYDPHKAREGSVVFPAFYDASSKADLDKLGEAFEDNEHKLFGENGFEKIVGDVASIEQGLGIYDLSQFTPKQGGE